MPRYTYEQLYQEARFDLTGEDECQFIEEGGLGYIPSTKSDFLLVLRIREEGRQRMKKRKVSREYYQRLQERLLEITRVRNSSNKEKFDTLPEGEKESIREKHRWAQSSYRDWKRAELAAKAREAQLRKKAEKSSEGKA
ncbi:hypothetical protein BT96DRAFT_1004245 [Gymnopus androsaceus JB14]|uniref:Uncharacterized protein n=1 Tax=Gymnopus androsaceus JB14 TaxID=1447944 RepID=A0A6A4GRU7_9AGAR|nr:hypothetical protein BT96DRAFT_1004245 [Gymnopus androsaceus JB14]